jgi:hypothetical protein
MTPKSRSSHYLCTIANDAEGQAKIAQMRKDASELNAKLKASGETRRLSVKLRPRLGKNSPHAFFYKALAHGSYRHPYQMIQVRHAAKFDVYTYYTAR